jgi:hypothetical protein
VGWSRGPETTLQHKLLSEKTRDKGLVACLQGKPARVPPGAGPSGATGLGAAGSVQSGRCSRVGSVGFGKSAQVCVEAGEGEGESTVGGGAQQPVIVDELGLGRTQL